MEQIEPTNDNDTVDASLSVSLGTNGKGNGNDLAPPTPKQLSTIESFTPPFPKIAQSPGLLARRAAAARAYALSSTPTSSSTNAYNPPRANTPTRGKSPKPKTLMANHQPEKAGIGMTWHLKNRLKELEGVGEEDYANFMRSLLVDDLEDGILSEFGMDTEEDEDYNFEADDLQPLDDYDDEDDKSQDTDAHRNGAATSQDAKGAAGQKIPKPTVDYYDTDFFLDPIALEEELGGLFEEDMEAAVNSLLQQDDNDGGMEPHQLFQRSPQKEPLQSASKTSTTPMGKQMSNVASTATRFPSPTDRQILHLQRLMNQHYQILIEQSTLAVRAAHGNKFRDSARGASKRKRTEHFFCSGENPDELAGILDGAVTMLQDLDKNRKDAIRYSIQMRRVRARISANDSATSNGAMTKTHLFYPSTAPSAARAILGGTSDDIQDEEQGILTRSAFSRTLRESDWKSEPMNPTHGFGAPGTGQHEQQVVMETSNSNLGASTTFGVRGLARLHETFAAIDNSINAYSDQAGTDGSTAQMLPAANVLDSDNIFSDQHHGRACEMLLRHARADYDRNLIPGYKDMTDLLTYPSEVMGEDTSIPMTLEQQRLLRHSRLQFTAAEDNLLLRGVNLYGEKEWVFISDRFLPDRTVSTIAQRYWRLCLLIYKGHSIDIDRNGKLQERSTPNGVEDLDEKAIKAALKPVQKPGVYGLYRWSMEEDLLLLKAVPLMGRLFAEIGKRFIPYRNRGALRKRYQVLERRVKGAMKRDKKSSVETRKRVNSLSKPKPYTPPSQGVTPSMYMKAHVASTTATVPSTAPQPYQIGYYPRPVMNTINNAVPPSYAAVHTPSVGYPPLPGAPPLPAPAPPKNGNESYCALRGVIEGELSQLSNFDVVNKMIEKDSTKRAQGPGQSNPPVYSQAPQNGAPAPSQFLPNMDYNNDSLSGLSVLAGGESNAAPAATKKNGNIMKSVMERTADSSSVQKSRETTSAEEYTHPQGYGNDSRYERVLPPSSQLNSNMPFSGSNLNISNPFEHSLMAPPELEAVEAATVLNQMNMSNSGVGFNPPNSYQAKIGKTETLKKTSFFQKVVGNKKK